MNQQKSDNSYFLSNAGHPLAVFRPPTHPKRPFDWNARLKYWPAAIAVAAAAALLWTAGGTVRPLEATVLMRKRLQTTSPASESKSPSSLMSASPPPARQRVQNRIERRTIDNGARGASH